MLIKKFTNIFTNFSRQRFVQTKLFQFQNKQFFALQTDQLTKKQQSNHELLQKVLNEVHLKRQKSIMMPQGQQIQQRRSHKLTKQDKIKLGLFIPKMALNQRMNISNQLQYKQLICQNLYDMQKQNLQTKVRILQKFTQSKQFTIDEYINSVYKDIYSRYLIGKGIGIQWEGRYSNYGILNSKKIRLNPRQMIGRFLKANVESFQKVESIAPYSYLTKKFVPAELIEVENLRKIGYYLRLPLTYFNKYEREFKKLKQKGSKIQLLIFCQYLQKMINPHCLCIVPQQKMLIMKRKVPQNNVQNQSSNKQLKAQLQLQYEYLVTSLQIFNKHKQYFQKNNYEKHLVFESDHLVGMKTQIVDVNNSSSLNKVYQQLPIISEISGYERDAGIYLVNGSTSIPDYQRCQYIFQEEGKNNKNIKGQDQDEKRLENVFDSSGNVMLKGLLDSKENMLSILKLDFEDKLFQNLKKFINFQQLYDVFQDQVYSNKQTSQILRFRIFQKYQLPIKEQSYKILQSYIKNQENQLILFESKVKLPKKRQFKKPKERRDFKKQFKQILKQKTQYMSIFQAIKSIQNIPITSSIEGDIKMWVEKDKYGNVLNIYQNVAEQQIKSQQSTLQEITISTDLISALSFMYSMEVNTQEKLNRNDLTQILIQPQTFTQEILPLCLHLIFFKTQKQENELKQRKGRRNNSKTKSQEQSQTVKAVKVLQSLKMIYLHPTVKQSQKDINIQKFILGSMKINNKHDYGYGFEAIRLWICRNSNYLGDREIKQTDINSELKNGQFIRKLYAQLIPLLPKSQVVQEIESNSLIKQELNLLDKFMLEQIDAFILNMEHFYSRLMIKQAYELTMDFYKNVIEEIFLQTIRKNIIVYPNKQENKKHAIVIKRILELLSVITPLFPFTSYHISKTQIMKWPKIQDKQNFGKNLLEYNSLIRIRTQLRNKLEINNFKHSQIVFPIDDSMGYGQNDLKYFFGVDKISFIQPQIKQKKFGFKMRHNETLGGKNKIYVYESKQYCIRCEPQSKQKEHLCHNCVQYLEENVNKQIEFYEKRNNLLFSEKKEKQQKIQQQRKISNQNEVRP